MNLLVCENTSIYNPRYQYSICYRIHYINMFSVCKKKQKQKRKKKAFLNRIQWKFPLKLKIYAVLVRKMGTKFNCLHANF